MRGDRDIAIGNCSLTFGIASAITTAGLIIWGVVRNRHARQIRTHRHV